MQVTPPRPPLTTGFLTVTGRAIEGLVGGYLLLNDRGRPLEFHCTAPVSANRAQEILYGSTLEGYLYGEQIAGSLIRRSRVSVATIFTDLPSVLCVRNQCEYPVSLVKRCTSPTGDVLDDPAAGAFLLSTGSKCRHRPNIRGTANASRPVRHPWGGGSIWTSPSPGFARPLTKRNERRRRDHGSTGGGPPSHQF